MMLGSGWEMIGGQRGLELSALIRSSKHGLTFHCLHNSGEREPKCRVIQNVKWNAPFAISGLKKAATTTISPAQNESTNVLAGVPGAGQPFLVAGAGLDNDMKRFEDRDDPLNGSEYWTGKECIEPGCCRPAGTAWSPFWCFDCNVKRMKRIDESLKKLVGC